MNRTKIEWVRNPPDNKTPGYTWNPFVGCSMSGCAVRQVCYARRTAKRFKQRCDLCYKFEPHCHPERIWQPTEVNKPSGIFVCSMAELFDEALNGLDIHAALDVMKRTPRHRYYLLTKKPTNARNFAIPDNAWVGVTVNLKKDLWRINELRKIDAKVRFISFEPLLEDLGPIDLSDIHWIIIGAQTRPDQQPPITALTNLIAQTNFYHIPPFIKNNIAPKTDNKAITQPPWQAFPKV